MKSKKFNEEEAAELLRISVARLQEVTKSGLIQCLEMLDGKIRYTLAQIEAFQLAFPKVDSGRAA